MGGSSSKTVTKVVQVKEKKVPEQDIIDNPYFQNELDNIRDMFAKESHVEFGDKAMFVLYAPPEYPTDWAAKYLGELLKLPVLHPSEYVHDPSQQVVGKSQSIKNMSSQYLLRQESQVEETPTREALRKRLYQPDCERGCVVYEYPDTCSELRYVKENMATHLKVHLLFLELDNETMRSLQKKWDRWIHPDSRRSYHLTFRPPKSFGGLFLAPTPEIMVDDETGEPLVQLEEDTLDHYKEELAKYQIREIPMFYEFEDISKIIPGGSNQQEVEVSIRRAIYQMMNERLKKKWRDVLDSAYANVHKAPEPNTITRTARVDKESERAKATHKASTTISSPTAISNGTAYTNDVLNLAEFTWS